MNNIFILEITFKCLNKINLLSTLLYYKMYILKIFLNVYIKNTFNKSREGFGALMKI
jgi:hypothetical protein